MYMQRAYGPSWTAAASRHAGDSTAQRAVALECATRCNPSTDVTQKCEMNAVRLPRRLALPGDVQLSRIGCKSEVQGTFDPGLVQTSNPRVAMHSATRACPCLQIKKSSVFQGSARMSVCRCHAALVLGVVVPW